MKKLILITLLASLSLPALALSDYNWQDYYLNPEGGDRIPLILPIMPNNNYHIQSVPMTVPQPVQILGNTSKPGSHVKIYSQGGVSDGWVDSFGHINQR